MVEIYFDITDQALFDWIISIPEGDWDIIIHIDESHQDMTGSLLAGLAGHDEARLWLADHFRDGDFSCRATVRSEGVILT